MPKQLTTSYKNFVRCSVPSCILRLGVLNYAVVWLCLIFGAERPISTSLYHFAARAVKCAKIRLSAGKNYMEE